MYKRQLKGQDILQRALTPDGFNVGFNFGRVAGAGIPQHLHAHIVPRWNGDVNFMPVIADTKVLPVALDSLWGRLLPFTGKIEQKVAKAAKQNHRKKSS